MNSEKLVSFATDNDGESYSEMLIYSIPSIQRESQSNTLKRRGVVFVNGYETFSLREICFPQS
jgi:hypothetical protein